MGTFKNKNPWKDWGRCGKRVVVKVGLRFIT